jgi:phosphoserine aminotransferase
MTDSTLPTTKPACPNFSSGPCAKRPGWTPKSLENAVLGRSHRAKIGKTRLKQSIGLTREVLNVPADYRIGIVPASDTGAVEMAMWSLLGARGVDMVAWESFGSTWVSDVIKQLKLTDVRKLTAGYGDIVDLATIDTKTRDVVFTWNGTTSGVRVPNADWIASEREGLTICDATSAAFAQDLEWSKLDVTTFSWQKALGGEAAHGVIILSPRAVARLESYTPAWPLPKIFQLTKGGKLIEGIFEGETINTPSMLCVEDYIDALQWAKSIGGLKGMMARADANLAALESWVATSSWAGFLAKTKETRSNTSVCLSIIDSDVVNKGADAVAAVAKALVSALDKQGVAYDIGAYRDAPSGLRIWCGATVETPDVAALTHWLDWAYAQAKAEVISKAA